MVNRNKKGNVFFYVPNLIGYVRLSLMVASFWTLNREDPILPATMYTFGQLLDAFDGTIARYLDQTSNFGMLLDMVIDRCLTCGLLSHLCHLYPQWAFWFQLFMCLDIASHYAITYTQISLSIESHKSFGASERNPYILQKYYSCRTFLFTLCGFNEAFIIFLYLYAKFFQLSQEVISPNLSELAEICKIMALSTFSFFALKQVINVLQLLSACITLTKA